MATLYEMTTAAQQLYDLLQNEEIDEQVLKDTLEGMGADEKVESYCKIICQFETDSEAFKAEKQRFADKQAQAENNVKRLKNNLLLFLNASGQKKVSAGLFTVSKATNQAINIFDESLIPAEFLKPQPPKIDKTGIRNAIKSGENVAGAEIITNESVRIK